tara:strand:- start:5772 stop:6248 length:477 start_codon:yes stop_codon:yes gene_type:complete
MNIIDLARFRRARATGSAGMIRPHRPDDRIVVETVSVAGGAAAFGHWEVRIFDPAGQFHHYFALRALLHVQLWHPFFGVSILTPSRLTGFNYELFPLNEWKYATPHYADIGDQLRSRMGIRMPDEAQVRRVCRACVGEAAPRESPPVMPTLKSTPHVR